jgi:hypothetical protein
MMVPLIGFVPDLPQTTLGAMVSCVGIIPSSTGFQTAPSGVDVVGVGPLAAPCRGGAIGSKTDGERRIFAGTQTKLYEYVGAAWVDRSKAGDYVGSPDSRWSFAQFGNFSIAANGVEPIQASETLAYASIAGAPIAKIVCTAANFVLAFNTSTAADQWACSGIFDHTTWTPSLTTQANAGRLVATGGAITAGLTFGQQVVVYKARSMYLGTYVGVPAVWQFDQVQGEVGCVGQEAVCDVMGAHVFVGEDNIWLFDGVRPRPLADGSVRQWFIANLSPRFKNRTIVSFERRFNRVWIFFPSTASEGDPDLALVYQMTTARWGRADRNVQAVMTFDEPGVTYDTLDDVAPTYDDMPDVAYDSEFWNAGAKSLGVFNTSNQLQTMVGQGAGTWTTWDMGDDDTVSTLDKVRLRWEALPLNTAVTTCAGSTRLVASAPLSMGSTSTLNDGKFDMRQSGRWHQLTISMPAGGSFSALDATLIPAGGR